MRRAPVDIVILILASAVAIVLVLSVVDIFISGYKVERAELIAQVIFAIIAIISLYIGKNLDK